MKMKLRHVYTVTREFDGTINHQALSAKKSSFIGIREAAGEYLYDGGADEEKIEVELQSSVDEGKTWQPVPT